MSIEVKVLGALQLQTLAQRLRHQGDKGLLQELRKALAKVDRPFEAAIRSGMPAYLPDRYAAVLAKSTKVRNAVKTVGRNVSVTMVVTSKGVKTERQIRQLDNPGNLRHPVFARGSRSGWTWAKQRVRPGVVSDAFEANIPRIRNDVLGAMNDVADKITKG